MFSIMRVPILKHSIIKTMVIEGEKKQDSLVRKFDDLNLVKEVRSTRRVTHSL